MAEIKKLFTLKSLPGIRRDGTELDGNFYTDGKWVRFQRGKPRKIGGYVRTTPYLQGPINNVLVWSRPSLNDIYTFHPDGIEMVQVDENGLGSNIIDRTPAGFSGDDEISWSADTLYDAASGSEKTLVLALPGDFLTEIDGRTERSLYVGDATTTGVFTDVSDVNAVASGGVFSAPPYSILYGNDGKVTWSNANEPQNYSSGDANTGRVTGSKLIKGTSIRSGNGPAGLLWALDAVIRMDWIGGESVFRFSTLSRQSSIISPNCVVEYDGVYYWVGIDRFMMCDGSQVRELPNDMNLNYFFDNINRSYKQKVWGIKIPKFGEIWWYFPKGDNTECSHAVIYNVRENIWYDVELGRSAGFHSQVFGYPVMTSTTTNDYRSATLTVSAGSFSVDDTFLGSSSGARGRIITVNGTTYRFELITQSTEFLDGEGVTNEDASGTAVISNINNLYGLYIHEKGKNVVKGEYVSAIQSYFVTSDIGLPAGGIVQDQVEGMNNWTRLIRIEPDFAQDGDMNMYVLGREFPNSEEVVSSPYSFSSTTEKIDLRIQQRLLRLKFESNTSDGDYQMGKVILHTEPGDNRS